MSIHSLHTNQSWVRRNEVYRIALYQSRIGQNMFSIEGSDRYKFADKQDDD